MSNWTPSIVPGGGDQNVYLVVSDFGRLGLAWCETDVEATDLETIITDLLDGQYTNPVRIVDLNLAERWSRNVSGRAIVVKLCRDLLCSQELQGDLDVEHSRRGREQPFVPSRDALCVVGDPQRAGRVG